MWARLTKDKAQRDITLIFIVALAVRLLFVLVYPALAGPLTPETIDPDEFGERAQSILAGQGFSVPDGTPATWREPLYSFFIAALWSVTGESRDIVQVANAALGGLAAVLTYLLAYYWYGRGMALAAAGLYTFFPLNIWYVPLYRYEALFTPLVALAGVCFIKLWQTLKWRYAVLMGLALGLATLNSQLVLLLPVVFIIVSFESPHRRRLLAGAGVAVLVMGAVIAPWTWRNYQVTGGKFIIVRQGGPVNFFRGNYAVNHYQEAPLQLSRLRQIEEKYEYIILEKARVESLDDINRVEMNRILGPELVKFVKEQPDQLAWKIIVQSIRFWYLGDTPAKSYFILAINLPLLILGGIGVYSAARRRKPFLLYLLTIAYFNFIYAVMWVEARYTVPLEPYLMVLASGGLLALLQPYRSLPARLPTRHFLRGNLSQ